MFFSTPKFPFEYKITRSKKRKRTISLKVLPSLEVAISAPLRAAEREILRFLKTKEKWILERISHYQQNPPKTNSGYKNGDYIKLLGRDILIKIERSKLVRGKGFSVLQGEELIVSISENLPENKLPEVIEKWYKDYALAHFLARSQYFSEVMKLKIGKVFIRSQKTRWGSCDAKNNIRYNWRAIKFSPEVVDYLVVHEIAHVKYRDHSQNFWNLVGKYISDYKLLRKKLINLD
jgi:predicted metal-dependent hydrolase